MVLQTVLCVYAINLHSFCKRSMYLQSLVAVPAFSGFINGFDRKSIPNKPRFENKSHFTTMQQWHQTPEYWRWSSIYCALFWLRCFTVIMDFLVVTVYETFKSLIYKIRVPGIEKKNLFLIYSMIIVVQYRTIEHVARHLRV